MKFAPWKNGRSRSKRSTPLSPPSISSPRTFSDAAENLNGLVSDLTEQASALKEQLFARAELLAQRTQLERSGAQAEAAQIVVPEVDRAGALASLHAGATTFETVSSEMTAKLYNLLAQAPALPDPAGQNALEQWKSRTREYLAGLPGTSEKLRTWSPDDADPVVSLDQLLPLWP